jgi:hypothetical protein
MAKTQQFPTEDSVLRLRQYGTYERLLEGNHYTAYIADVGKDFSERFKYLRYLQCNFAGLISKVMADVLFGEKATIESKDKNKEQQAFIDALVYENRLDTQLYESALFNSARGDAVLRVRVDDDQIKIEDINPAMYYPEVGGNFRDEPEVKILAWKTYYEKEDGKVDTYLIKEIHTVGLIETRIYLMKGKDEKEIAKPVAIDEYNELMGTDFKETVETKIDVIPIIHIPNFRINNSYWGVSDYHDLQSIFFAINNRMTSVDNILDKHGDPILAVPEGILDENGNVQKEKLGMVEVRTGEDRPEYVVWNANLDVAFQQIDELIKMVFLIGEISPDVVGLDTGKSGAESGRALKLRMLRTLAKKNRKALYYEEAIQRAIETASKFANNGFKAGDVKYKGEPIVPNVTFADGIVDDKVEEITNETMKLEAGLTSKKRAIKVIEDMDDKEAERVVKEIEKDDESKADISEEAFHLRAKVNDTERLNKEGEAV